MTEIVPNLNEKQELQQARLDFGPGQLLAEARHKAQLTTQQIADSLHIKAAIIEALERDDYSNLPPRTFVRGYLRGYSEIVGIDADMILSRHAKLTDSEEASSTGIARRAARFKKKKDRSGILLWLFLIVITVVLVWFWWSKWGANVFNSSPADDNEIAVLPGPEEKPATNPLPTSLIPPIEQAAMPDRGASRADPVETETVDQVENEVAENTDLNDDSGRDDSGQDNLREDAGESVAVVTEAVSGTQDEAVDDSENRNSALQDGKAELLFRFSGTSWMMVKDATGKRLIAGMVQGPANRTVQGELPIEVLIGDSGVVALDVNGKAYDFGPTAKGRKAKFVIDF